MRKTTSYLVRVLVREGEKPNDVIDVLVKTSPVTVEQTASLSEGWVGIRFRIATNDISAMDTAREIAGDRPWLLTTGYGVHVRHIGAST